jgi:hypothetical protein
MSEKFLPVGVQNFQKMRLGNFVYVDKTEYIYQLIRPLQGFYFLSRPRRFGKSLMVSTLDYLFQGRKDLFEGLWIHENTDWEWEKHPVVIIDFNRINHDSPDNLKMSILIKLRQVAKLHQIEIDSPFISDSFATLISQLEEKYGQSVIVLIDEYDKPLISHLGKGENELEIAKQNRDILKQFFGVLKEQDVSGALRLVFITGISKFSRVSIFSDLNNLDDLSMQAEFGAILGYTEDELERYFFQSIDKLSKKLEISYQACKEKLQTWYNGYRFTEHDEKVYCPFSILNVFKKRKFRNYWFETGTPSFLVSLIKEKNYPIAEIENLQLDEDTFTIYDLENLRLEALLFQTGYITIEKYDGIFYQLNYPNQEVKKSFLKYLYSEMVEIASPTLKDSYGLLAVQLQKSDLKDFIETVNAILSSIPYTQIAHQDKSYYHTIFYLMLSASGVLVLTEVLTSKGRTDIAVEFPDKVYVIELKCNHSADKAIAQIKGKKYADKYRASGRAIYLVGINFDTSVREITDWKMEKLTL